MVKLQSGISISISKHYSHDACERFHAVIRVSLSVSTQKSHPYIWYWQHLDYWARSNPSQEGEGVILVIDIVLVTAEQRCKKWQIWQMYLCYSFQSGATFVVQCTDRNRKVNIVLSDLCYQHSGHSTDLIVEQCI